MAQEALDPKRTGLVFFDTLKIYACEQDYKTLRPEAVAQVEACVHLLALARENHIPVFYARADHRPDGRDRSPVLSDDELLRAGRPRDPSDPFAAGPRIWGTEGAEIIDELAPEPSDYQIFKHRWNMFFQTELELSLRARDIDTILLAGGSTEVGIAASAYAARDLDLHVVLVRECVRSGRGRYVSDFFVDEVAPSFTRVRSLQQVEEMLRSDGREADSWLGEAATLPEPPTPLFAPTSGDPSIDPRQTAVLLFDVLKGGFYDRQTRALREAAEPTIAAARRMVEAARSVGMPVFYARADHRADGADWASSLNDRDSHRLEEHFGRLRIRPGLVRGAWEAEIVDELAPKPGDYVVRKHRWSAFYATHLELSLRTAGISNILLAGTSTAIGVASTAYSGRDRDFNIVVLRDACRGASPAIDAYFMGHVFPRLGRVRTVDQAIALLG